MDPTTLITVVTSLMAACGALVLGILKVTHRRRTSEAPPSDEKRHRHRHQHNYSSAPLPPPPRPPSESQQNLPPFNPDQSNRFEFATKADIYRLEAQSNSLERDIKDIDRRVWTIESDRRYGRHPSVTFPKVDKDESK